VSVDLVFLHGHESRPGAMLPLAESLSISFPDWDKRLFTGPVMLGDAGHRSFAWWDESSAEFADHISGVEWLRPRIENPSVLIGFSQGAALALSAAFAIKRVPNIVGVVSIGGFVPDGVSVAAFGGPLLVIHGENDERVDTLYAERLHRQASSLGIDSQLALHPGGHVVPSDLSVLTDFLQKGEWT
jgi:predicted esterase